MQKYKIDYKRLFIIVAVLCSVSVCINILSVCHFRRTQQRYAHYAIYNIRNLEIILWSMNYDVETQNDPRENHINWERFRPTIVSLNHNIHMLSLHHNNRYPSEAITDELESHLRMLFDQVNNGEYEEAQDFIVYLHSQVVELFEELTVGADGDYISSRTINTAISTRQVLRHINTFISNVNTELDSLLPL